MCVHRRQRSLQLQIINYVQIGKEGNEILYTENPKEWHMYTIARANGDVQQSKRVQDQIKNQVSF